MSPGASQGFFQFRMHGVDFNPGVLRSPLLAGEIYTLYFVLS